MPSTQQPGWRRRAFPTPVSVKVWRLSHTVTSRIGFTGPGQVWNSTVLSSYTSAISASGRGRRPRAPASATAGAPLRASPDRRGKPGKGPFPEHIFQKPVHRHAFNLAGGTVRIDERGVFHLGLAQDAAGVARLLIQGKPLGSTSARFMAGRSPFLRVRTRPTGM